MNSLLPSKKILIALLVILTAAIGGVLYGLPQSSAMSQSDEFHLRVAYIARENAGVDDQPPKFNAYVASDDSDDAPVLEELTDSASVDQALAWARNRAARVVVSYGFSGEALFSAGSTYYDGGSVDDPLPTWPPPAHVLADLDARALRLQEQRSSEDKLGVDEPEERQRDE